MRLSNVLLLSCLAIFGHSLIAQPRPKAVATKKTVHQAKTVPSVRILTVPAADQLGKAEFCQLDTTYKTYSVLPSGRYVTPAGQTIRITNDPFGLAVSPDGQRAVALHEGVISVIDLDKSLQVTRFPRYGSRQNAPVKDGSFLGVAIAADGKTAYLSNGDKGRVVIFDLDKQETIGDIDLNDSTFADSFTSDLLLNTAKNELLVLDRGNFRLVRIDLTTRKITASIPAGRQPFGLALSPDHTLAFVANVGLYVYPKVPGVTPKNGDTMMLQFPPYGALTREARDGVKAEGQQIPGLGDPMSDEAMSVWTVDLATNKVVSRLKTGLQIGEMIEEAEIGPAEVVGGASPNSVVVGSRFAYVSNATNDNLSIIDYRAGKIVGTIPLHVDPLIDHYRGLMPFGLTLSRDEKTIYVALLAFNAVAVVDVATRKVRGLIPAGWGPTRVSLSPDETRLYITSARGLGAGPNGGRGFVTPPSGTYIGDIQLGTFQAVPVPDAAQLTSMTKQVIANTFRAVTLTNDPKNPLPALPKGGSTPIKHIVYITKENRTYDEVFGQFRTGNGDSTLARYGVDVTVRHRKDTLTHVAVMPNHHRAARQWAFSDNFYCDSDASIHGHHWMMGTVPNEWIEANAASEGRIDPFSKAIGRRFPKSSGGIDPEDYNEIGGLWENLERHKISFYNFGQVNEFATNSEEQMDTLFGTRHPIPFPMPNAAFKHTSRNFAGFNCNIPDQFRQEQFEREFTAKWLSPSKKTEKSTLPQLLTVMLPNDHGAGVRPKDGYPYPHSFMADNDLAVGRMLQFLSHTPYWKDMLVIITEDDPQGGVDHVDAHRSLLMLAGPYVKRGYVSHTHANFGSILKVIYNLLHIPYVNQYDATASLLQDFFTDKPDFTPYTAVLPDVRVFDPTTAMKPYGKNFDWKKIQRVTDMDNKAAQRAEHYRENE